VPLVSSPPSMREFFSEENFPQPVTEGRGRRGMVTDCTRMATARGMARQRRLFVLRRQSDPRELPVSPFSTQYRSLPIRERRQPHEEEAAL